MAAIPGHRRFHNRQEETLKGIVGGGFLFYVNRNHSADLATVRIEDIRSLLDSFRRFYVTLPARKSAPIDPIRASSFKTNYSKPANQGTSSQGAGPLYPYP